NYVTTTKYPLIIFLHGISERGNGTTELYKIKSQGIPKYIEAGNKMTFTWNGKTETFLVLMPQCRKTDSLWYPFYVDEMIKYAKNNLSIDTNRIILTGLSMGGGGVWQNSCGSIAQASRFAAITPVAAACLMNNGRNIALGKPSVYAFHGLNDATPVAKGSCTVAALAEINKNAPPMQAVGTLYNTTSHVVWPMAYDTTYKYQNPTVYEWWLNQKRNLTPNKLPVSNAGNDTLIHSASGKATLRGALSSDPDGTILKYIWKKVGGPAGGTITNGSTVLASVSGLKTSGVYLFELEVIDNRASWKFDTMKVTVNASPITNAGVDSSITLPTNIYRLNGSLSRDPDGSIISYKWTRVSGPNIPVFVNATSAITDVKSLIQGVYRFRLTVTDNRNSVTTDDMYLTVKASTLVSVNRQTGIDQEKEGVSLYYDDASKVLFIKGLQQNNTQHILKVYDYNGRIVERQQLNSDRRLLNRLTSGVYIVEIVSGQNVYREKIRVR
ncbi:MAG: PKD domain-containing protein, partial [Flavitalea sp.]